MKPKFLLTPWRMDFNLISEQMPLIDLRSSAEYERAHVKGASHFPIETLVERLSELPSHEKILSLFGSDEALIQATGLLTQKNYQINHQITASSNFFQQLSRKGWLEVGKQSKQLWQPAPVVKYFIETLDHFSIAQKRTGLDLACGAGRDSLYLAQQGWQMTAIDYNQSALDKLQQTSNRLQLRLHRQLLDLEKNFSVLLRQKRQYDLIVVIRYLHRPLLASLPQLLAKNGILIYQTFLQGCEKFGSPKNPRFLLKSNELAQVYSDLNILYDQREILPDGRPTNAFIAQRLD